MRRTAIALAAVALLALPASANPADEMTIMAPAKGKAVELPLQGARIKKMTLDFDGTHAIIRAEFKPTLKQRAARKVRAIKAGIKKIGSKARHALTSTAETVGHGLKAAGHGIVVLNDKAAPATRCVSTVAAWAGAYFFLHGKGLF